MTGRISRRNFLKSTAIAAGAAILAACAPVATVEEPKAGEEDVQGVEEGTAGEPAPESRTLVFFRAESEIPQWSLTRDKPLVFEWFEEATGVHIEFDVVPQQDYEQVFNLRAAAGDIQADIIQMQGMSDGAYLARNYRDGVIISLDELLDRHAPNILALSEEYPDYRRDLSLPDTGYIAVGSANISPYDMRVWTIRLDWLEKLGLDVPGTLEELADVAVEFATNDPNGNGLADESGMLSGDGLWGLIVQTGYAYGLVGMVDAWRVKDGQVANDWVDPYFFDSLQFLNQCVQGGALPPDYDDANMDFATVMSKATNGEVGLWVRAPLVLPALLNWSEFATQKTDPTARWINTPLPPTPDGTRVSDVEPVATRWRTYGITTQCKEPEMAMEWLDFVFASPEGRDIFHYGKEGLTYERKPDGTKERLVTFEGGAIVEEPLAGEWFGSEITMPYLSDATLSENQLKEWEATEWCLSTITDLLPYGRPAGQSPILLPEQADEVGRLMTDCKTYKDEMWAKFVAGDTPLTEETFEQYVATLEKMGLEKVRQMYQDAYSG